MIKPRNLEKKKNCVYRNRSKYNQELITKEKKIEKRTTYVSSESQFVDEFQL